MPFSVVSKDKEFPYALNTNLLVKIHGDLNDTEIVLKEDDYLDYSTNHPLIEAFVKSVFATKVVLFIGYSFSDVNLKMIIQTVRNILGKDFQNAYLLSIDENLHPTQRDYLKNKGVNVVNYYDSVIENEENYIEEYLNGINALNENYFKKGEKLSKEGQVLLNFLRFIAKYEKFNEPLSERNIIDQMYLSLNRFIEITTLPPDFIANLYPFNISSSHVSNYKSYTLSTSNKALVDLFYNHIEYIDGDIKLKPSFSLNSKQHFDFEEKIRIILKRLNYSLILLLFEIQSPIKKNNITKDESINLFLKETKICKCFNCRYGRFEFSNAVSDINNLKIEEKSSIQSDFELAYAYYKLGNFTLSYQLFEEIANKSWQSAKYISYYIAKHNVKTLRNLIRHYEQSLNETKINSIIKELEDIDFDKLLSQIPFIGLKEYEMLKIIRDDEVLINAEIEIHSLYDKILEIYERYKFNRGWASGTYYGEAVQIELNKIFFFYRNNFIVIDEYSNFTRVCKKGVEALLISFATSEQHTEKLKEFDINIFIIVILYGDVEDFIELCRRYEINEIIFNEESHKEVIQFVHNFFNSFFEFNPYTGSTQPNKKIKTQIENEFWLNKCNAVAKNIFGVLSLINFNKETIENFIENILKFIEHENFVRDFDVKYICAFIWKNRKYFQEKDFEKLLRVIANKKHYYQRSQLLQVIASAFVEFNLQRIEDKDLIESILLCSIDAETKNNIIIDLWCISGEEIKKELKSEILNILNSKFNIDLYIKSVHDEIIDFNIYFETYLKEVNLKKGNDDYTIKDEKFIRNNYLFFYAMIFIYQINIKSDDKRLKLLKNLNDCQRFFLNPEKFDYTKFKMEWLHLTKKYDFFYKRFSKINALKKKIEIELKNTYDEELSKLYIKYFLK